MRYRYYYCKRYSPNLIDFLVENKIRYTVSGEGIPDDSYVIFSIWSNQKNAEYCVQELKQMNMIPLVFTDYSESDRMSAKLLWLWPKSQKIQIINGEESFDFGCMYTSIMGFRCYKHEEQKSLVAIAKEPPLNTRNAFWTVDDSFSELFVNRQIYEAVRSSSLNGIDFLNVILRNGKYSENIFQITSKNLIGRECIEKGHGEIIERCGVCGKEQYSINSGEYQLHLDFTKIDNQSDLYVTERMFGAGIAYPLYVISQRFYRLLKENGLTGGAKFSPVIEVGSLP